MALKIGKASAGGFWKPKDDMGAEAILIIPKYTKEITSGDYGTKPAAVGDVFIFANKNAVEAGQVRELLDVAWQGAWCVPAAENIIEDPGSEAMIITVVPAKGQGVKFQDVTDVSLVEMVAKWYEKRTASLDAAIDEMDDDFND